jgi:hypothetical protein
MSLLWCSYFLFVKFQITYGDLNISNIIEFGHLTAKHPHVTILGALTNEKHIKILNNTPIYSNKDIRISSESFILDSNPLLTTIKLCEIGNLSHAKIIIAGHTTDDDLTLTAISYVSDFYHVPLLTIGSRENIFSDEVNETGEESQTKNFFSR